MKLVYWKLVYFYAKVIAGTMIVTGLLGAIAGIPFYVIGAIPGLFFVWLGWKFYKTIKYHEGLTKTSAEKDSRTRFVNGTLGIFVTGFIVFAVVFAVFFVWAFYEYNQSIL